EKKAVAAFQPLYVGRGLLRSASSRGVTLQGDQKLWDSQLRDVQYYACQILEWLDYYMYAQLQDKTSRPELTFLVAFRRNYIDSISSISQSRLNNLFNLARISCKAPPISPASAPQLIDPSAMRG
ncbi:hypothetical protein BGZ83_002203, partial [Gryganskiella cystojenkinii]